MIPNSPRDSAQWTERVFARWTRSLTDVRAHYRGLGPYGGVGLKKGAVRAALGHETALCQLIADQAPGTGRWVVLLRQMPHRLADAHRLKKLRLHLKNLEMSAHDLPLHFGAYSSRASWTTIWPASVSSRRRCIRSRHRRQFRFLSDEPGAMDERGAPIP